MAICSIRRLNRLAPFAMAANVIYLSAVGIIVYYFFTNLKSSDQLTKFGSIRNLPLAFGLFIYSFEGVSVVSFVCSCFSQLFLGNDNRESNAVSSNVYCLEWSFEYVLRRSHGHLCCNWVSY